MAKTVLHTSSMHARSAILSTWTQMMIKPRDPVKGVVTSVVTCFQPPEWHDVIFPRLNTLSFLLENALTLAINQTLTLTPILALTLTLTPFLTKTQSYINLFGCLKYLIYEIYILFYAVSTIHKILHANSTILEQYLKCLWRQVSWCNVQNTVLTRRCLCSVHGEVHL